MDNNDIVNNNPIIGITEWRLSEIIKEAVMRGYEMARKAQEEGEWLTSRAQICEFLSPKKPISPTTFNRNRAKGMYGHAVIGNGVRCKAKKNELLEAVRRYELAQC